MKKDSLTTFKDVRVENNTKMSSFEEGLSIEIIGGIVAGIILLIIVFLRKKIAAFFRNQSIKKSVSTPELKTEDELKIKNSFQELQKKLKMIVIDDDEIFPVDGFLEFGYNIQRWEKLDAGRLKQLHDGEFDIIILDIYGVATEIALNDGLDILEDLKSRNPSQVVIAYSSHSFDFSKNKFWEMADEKLGKPTPFVGTQKLIDNLIEKTFTIEYHTTKVKAILNNNNHSSEYAIIINDFVKFKESETEPNWMEYLNRLNLRNGEKSKLAAIFTKLNKISKHK